MLFSSQSGKPQYQNDLKTVERLRCVNPDRVNSKDITELAMLLIRYQYPSDLQQIATDWGFSLNSLLANARSSWERGEYVSNDTEMNGSGWDAASND